MKKVKVLVAQSCWTLCDPMDCNPPDSSVRGILQAKMLEWVAVPSLGDLPGPGIEPRSPHCRQILCHLSHQESVFKKSLILKKKLKCPEIL